MCQPCGEERAVLQLNSEYANVIRHFPDEYDPKFRYGLLLYQEWQQIVQQVASDRKVFLQVLQEDVQKKEVKAVC